MIEFDPQSYGPAMAGLIDPGRICQLGPDQPNATARDKLAALQLESAFAPRTVVDADMAECCLAGLWLGHGFLDESHSISQRIHTSSGSFWHGIMHRREEDFSNAKYWFRRVGEHPVFDSLAAAARDMASSERATGSAEYLLRQTNWDPFRFVDLCQAVQSGEVPSENVCRGIARFEWQLLFDYCFREAAGA